MADVRDPIQEDLVDMYIMADKMKCSMILPTGIGKSKIAFDIVKKTNPSHIYIIVESTTGKDISWPKEAKKFAPTMVDNFITFTTYQKLSRGNNNLIDDPQTLVIMDEVDFMAATPKYSKVIELFPRSRVLGLTGFVTEDKKDWFSKNLPRLITITPREAQNHGILNKIKFIFVKYDLSLNPEDHTVEYKAANGETKSFTQSENKAYEYEDGTFHKLVVQQAMLEQNFKRGDLNYQQYQVGLQKTEYKLKYCINRRQELLFNSVSTANMAKKLIGYVESNFPESKLLMFSKRTAQVDKIVGFKRAYHGKRLASEARITFEQFNSGEIKVLGTCQKVQRGINVDNLDYGLLETFIGSDTLAVQKFGRLMRLSPDKEATCFVLLPYWMKEQEDKTYRSEPTQQVTWATSMLRSTDITNSEVWDYRSIQTD